MCGGGVVAAGGVYGLGLQDRTQRKIGVCVTWEGCNGKMLGYRYVTEKIDIR